VIRLDDATSVILLVRALPASKCSRLPGTAQDNLPAISSTASDEARACAFNGRAEIHDGWSDVAAAIDGMCRSRDLAGQRRYVIMKACRGGRPGGRDAI
jgi:hypothetical protein